MRSQIVGTTIHRHVAAGAVCSAFVGVASWLFVAHGALADEPPLGPHEITTFLNLRYGDEKCKACTLDLAMPSASHPEPRPAIVVIHGGGWLEGDKSSFTTAEHQVPGNIVDFARLGFVAATINYRLSGETPFPAALVDCRCAVRWLRAHADKYSIDVNRIGAYGNSAGGHLALMLAMTPVAEGHESGPHADQSSRVQAAASDSGPLDLLRQHRQNQLHTVIERFMGGPPDGARLEDYKRASPSAYVSANERLPPLLLIYGEADTQVDVTTADDLVAMLSRAGHKNLTYVRLAGVDHCPHSLVRIAYLRPVVNEFFARALKLEQPLDNR